MRGVIREDDYQAGRVGFFGTRDPRQGGDASRFSLAGDVQTKQGSTTYSQQIFLIELDHPRLRKVLVTVVGC